MLSSNHYHVRAICTDCGLAAQKDIHHTLVEAQGSLRTAPEDLRQGVPLETTLLDADLMRIKTEEHTILAFTSECELEFQSCYMQHEAIKHASEMAEKINSLLRSLQNSGELDSLIKEGLTGSFAPSTQNNEPVDRSAALLSQLNLPEDFLGENN